MVETVEQLTLAQFVQKIRGDVRPVLSFRYPYNDREIILVDVGGKYEIWGVGGSTIRTVTGTNPAAGAEVVEAVPAERKWRVMAVSVVRTNAGVGGNRGHSIVIDSGLATQRLLMIDIGTATTIGTTRTLLWTFGNATSAVGPLSTTDSGETLIIPDKFPYDVVIPAGYRIRTVTTGGDAADTYTGIFIQVEEWVT